MSTYTAEALSQAGRRIKVTLQTESGSDSVEAGSDGLYLASDEAVVITREAPADDDALLPASLSLKLLSSEWRADFFTRTETGIAVRCERDGVLLFAGYVEPMAYSQPFNEVLDEVELSCIDCLSALQYRKWGGVGRAGVDFKALRQAAALRTFADVVTEALTATAAPVLGSEARIVWDGSLALTAATASAHTFMQDVEVSEALFLGEDEDDAWTLQDVLTELLRYLGLRCLQVGETFYLFNPDTVAAGGSITWYALDGSTAMTTAAETLTLTNAEAADTDTKLSLGEAFSRVSVEADREELDNPVPTPMESSALTALFGARQLALTVIEAGGEGERAKRNFRHMVLGEDIDSNYGAAAVTDWYVRLRGSENWTFAAWDGSARVPDLYASLSTTEHQEAAVRYLGSHVGAALVAWGKRERDVYKKKNTPTATVQMTDYLVISTSPQPSTAARWTVDSTALLGAAPVASYVGPANSAVFSPADDDTTNYLLLSGNIVLCPHLSVSHYYPDYVGTEADTAFSDTATQPYTEHDDGCLRTVHAWQAAQPTDSAADAAAASYPYLPPYTEHVPEQLPWPGLTVLATYNRVPCLRCMLIIGNKCCVEARNDAGTAQGTYSWQTFKERADCVSDSEYFRQSFSLGFRPDKGDKLVGHSFSIESNVTLSMGLDSEGLALPIKRADALSGQVRFYILGPENVAYSNTKVCLTSPDFYTYPAASLSGYKSLLSYVAAVMLSNFKVKFKSDGGFFDRGEDNDLVYESDTDEAFDHRRDAISLKITTALTKEERAELGVKSGLFISEPAVAATGLPLTEVYSPREAATAKPERLLVDALYRRLHQPPFTMEQTVTEAAADHSPFCLYAHPALPGRLFMAEGEERDLQADTLRVTARKVEQ